MDRPEEAAAYAENALTAAPGSKEAIDQSARGRERLERAVVAGFRASRDSDDLDIYEASLSARARPVAGLEIEGTARQRYFRQGSPGNEANVDNVSSADGWGGTLSASYRGASDLELRGAVGYDRYDVGDFHPWSGRRGITAFPTDTVRCSLEWERSHFDTILSFQNRVTADSVGITVARHFLWKTEISASASLLYHHNRNETGQDRENRGESAGVDVTRTLLSRGDDARLAGILRLAWKDFAKLLDVGVFNPDRYTAEEAGLEWLWRFRPAWEFRGTVMGGAEQEKGHAGGTTYSAETELDRRIGNGVITAGAFISDSIARGQGEGFRRYGGLIRLRIPF